MTDTLARMRQLVGTTVQWAANDLVIGDGEIAVERLADGSLALRVGNGVLRFSQLLPLGSNATTIVYGDGVADNSVAVGAANLRGKPITFVGVSVVNSPVTITAPIVDTFAQIFSLASKVTIANGQPVRPEWWGISNVGAVQAAVAALPAAGGVVQLEVATYKPNGHVYGAGAAAGVGMTKDNVKILGRKLPTVAADCRSLQAGSGSIIQGPFIVFANNAELCDLGIDDGYSVVQTYNGGTVAPGSWGEGLLCTYPSDTLKSAAAQRRGLALRDVCGLSVSPTAPCHAVILAEGYTDVRSTGVVRGIYGVHGVVIKAAGVSVQRVEAYLNGTDGFILKTDAQASAACNSVQVGQVAVSARGPTGTTPYVDAPGTGYGVLFHPAGGAMDEIQLGQVNVAGFPTALGLTWGGNYILSSVTIQSLIADCAGVAGTTYGVQLNTANALQQVLRLHFGSVEVRNAGAGVQTLIFAPANIDSHLRIDRLETINVVNPLDIGQATYIGIGEVIVARANDAIFHITGTPKISIGSVFKDLATPAWWSVATSGQAPSLLNGWVQVASNDPFGVDLLGGRVCLRGLVRPGTTNTLTKLPRFAWPASVKRFMAQGKAAAGVVAVPVAVATNGDVLVNEVAGGFANCTDWLSLSGITFDQQA